mmetsp:Transcript_23008/g.48981  ORF Transcript_23008/g.48981 Transcript_23008/m.48981 type:complete len:128 (+) Transcript_23008:183-566(+)|eukprot:CAMPEP_0201116394 /NCGR_PEP_ID=MMETSP0850-20130426/698_1 /ASSEMBLY_ACC=CAM_ASM_000622 /TAXON_ID=183588 /ORGANISM="Pseudo-nitzschia fraudulenta, Strain WWA7" /LENGTH=127 /DNA_ID=CAMNT_0047380467 /DNA_START=90 /DNA_END=473 /DNA_ORIENTATION=-
MPSATAIVKSLCTVSALPGLFMTLMGVGLAPVDEQIGKMAGPFIDPLGIPLRPFLCLLGPCKILGSFSLWGIGPMPEWFGRPGLMFSALCGAYGHSVVGESVIPPIAYVGMIFSLYFLDPLVKGKKE